MKPIFFLIKIKNYRKNRNVIKKKKKKNTLDIIIFLRNILVLDAIIIHNNL